MDPVSRRKEMPKTDIAMTEQATRNLGRPSTKAHNATTDKWISPQPISRSRARHLDVDAVLARSLPRVASE
jgi:hypothetical protein